MATLARTLRPRSLLALIAAALPLVIGASVHAADAPYDGAWRGKFSCSPAGQGATTGFVQDIRGRVAGGKLHFVIHYNFGKPFDVDGTLDTDGKLSVRQALATHDSDTFILSGQANSGELAASGTLGQRPCSIAMLRERPRLAASTDPMAEPPTAKATTAAPAEKSAPTSVPAASAPAPAAAAPVASEVPRPTQSLQPVSSAADKLLAELRAEVEKERQSLAEERQKLAAERQRMAEANAAAEDKAKAAAAAERQQLEAERQKLAAEKAAIAEAAADASRQRQAALAAQQSKAVAGQNDGRQAPTPSALDFDPGRYHALVIGNNSYKNLPKLKTAVGDAQAVAKVLADRYGFQVTMLTDATRYQILTALAKLRSTLKLDDNLLIYYAGHGVLDEGADAGYWLPIDAENDNPANWVSTTDLTNSMRAMDSRHVMIVADSCYSGTLLRGVATAPRGDTDRKVWLKRMEEKRSRTALTSGGLEPVADGGGSGHSVFTKAFLDALTENAEPIDGQALFAMVRRPVVLNADQTPAYADIRSAGHDGGDFILVPKVLRGAR